MFKISTIDAQSRRMLILGGTVIEPWFAELRTTWRNASQELSGCKLVIDEARCWSARGGLENSVTYQRSNTAIAIGMSLALLTLARKVSSVYEFQS